MEPFSLYQKQEGRGGNVVSYVRHVELHAYGVVYRLSRDGLTRNNIRISVPFKDEHGVSVGRLGGRLSLTTSFGLTVNYADAFSEVLLCNAYANHVCGLCGNADGMKSFFNTPKRCKNKQIEMK